MLFEIVIALFLVLVVVLYLAYKPKPYRTFTHWLGSDDITPLPKGYTDLSKWHLDNEGESGRQIWKYLDNDSSFKQNFVDRYHVGLYDGTEFPLEKAKTPLDSARNGLKFYSRLQSDDGHWSNDYGGPMFLLPGYVFTYFVSGTPIPDPHRQEMAHYLTKVQNKDGGWGLHSEGHSTVFGTVLNYCTFRLLGASKDDERLVKARAWIKKHGGAKWIPPWGAFWLATIGVYEWEGMVPLLPEIWLLPYWLPIHPGRFWCHARMVYLPMSYIYGLKPQVSNLNIIKELREEVWVEKWEDIDWAGCRNTTHELDIFKIHWEKYRGKALAIVNWVQVMYEKFHSKKLRKMALDETYDHLTFDDEYTSYVDIGPVNKMMNMLAVFLTEGKSKNFFKHADRARDYIWIGIEGMLMQGYNGSQLWDTAFALQAYVNSGLAHEFPEVISKGYTYLDNCQVRENARDPVKYYRHEAKGAWPFSTKTHGWPISDCTSEGLRAEMLLMDFPGIKERSLSDQRRFDAINVILSYQNEDGGWPTYENQRSTRLLEYINPSEVFGDIMVDYSYVELCSTCVRTLSFFRKRYPDHRKDQIGKAIEKGIKYIKNKQQEDGGFYGSWASCFSYAGWFASEALVMYGETYESSEVLRKLAAYFLSKQNPDGSWGEDFNSCRDHVWVPNLKGGQHAQTAWVLIALMRMKFPKEEIIKNGVKWLMMKQKQDGNWDYDTIVGQFNSSCSIKYDGYKNYFPVWALGMYAQLYGNSV